MPLPVVRADLAAGRLKRIFFEGPQSMIMAMNVVYRSDSLPGQAARWLIGELLADDG